MSGSLEFVYYIAGGYLMALSRDPETQAVLCPNCQAPMANVDGASDDDALQCENCDLYLDGVQLDELDTSD
jgi:hypothetical protein